MAAFTGRDKAKRGGTSTRSSASFSALFPVSMD